MTQGAALDQDFENAEADVTVVAHDVGGLGGMERQLGALVTGLLERGLGVVVVSRTLDLPAHPRLVWRRVPGPARPFALAYPWFAFFGSLIVLIRREGIVHTTGAVVLNRADLCTVHYLHNGRARALKRTRRTTFPYRLNAATAGIMSRVLERFVYGRAGMSGALVAVSDSLAMEVTEAFPSRAGAVRTIRNGVDARRFRPDGGARRDVRRELGIPNDVKLALFVGSEWRQKGIDVAVEALTEAPTWHLAVVGRGDDVALAERAANLGVRPRVHLLGEVRLLERYYAAVDAFVLPSAYETFSLAALEAAASGVPVVATDVGVIGGLVARGGGILVERNGPSVATALRRLEGSTELAAGMSRRARRHAQRFDWEAVSEAYVALYKEVREAKMTRAGRRQVAA
jgi:UDP-glucose:(heptosyl)LPS alpha-1,3-glucosyltransferase